MHPSPLGWVYVKECKTKRNTLWGSLRINQIYLKIGTQGFLESLITDLYSDLINSKWRIQYDGQINLINSYKPRAPYWIRHFEMFRKHLQPSYLHKKRTNLYGCVIDFICTQHPVYLNKSLATSLERTKR